MRNRPAIKISDEARARAIASIRRYFAEQLEQEIGDLKANLVFDYFVTEHGPTIYNQAIADARAFFEERTTDLAAICYQAEFPFWSQARHGASISGVAKRQPNGR